MAASPPQELIRPPAPSARVRSQKFLGTLFPPNCHDDLCTWRPQNTDTFRRAAWSHEICPRTQRHHIQIYVETKSPVSYSQLTSSIGLQPSEVHWEQARHPVKSWEYCTEEKEDASSRHGCPAQKLGLKPRGERSEVGLGRDLSLLYESLGKRPHSELVSEFPEQYLKHPAGIKFITQIKASPTNKPSSFRKPEVYVIFGGTGVGKDRLVRDICERHHLSLWVQPISTRGTWYDGVDNHNAALFPDFDGDMPFRELLRITEGYPVQVPVKGGFTLWHPKVVFFTSDSHPNSWTFIRDTLSRERSLLSPDLQAQLWRRITRIYHLRRPQPIAHALAPVTEALPPPTEILDANNFFPEPLEPLFEDIIE